MTKLPAVAVMVGVKVVTRAIAALVAELSADVTVTAAILLMLLLLIAGLYPKVLATLRESRRWNVISISWLIRRLGGSRASRAEQSGWKEGKRGRLRNGRR